MAKVMKKAQTGKKLTPARTKQVADSLDYEAARKTSGAYSALRSGKTDIWRYGVDEATRNTDNAKRYRSLADKAEGKKPMKSGGMLKRADGSYSKRGLWDNIRANKGSGKKPTAAMLKQEKKIKAKTK
jgi:hypothetical protein